MTEPNSKTSISPETGLQQTPNEIAPTEFKYKIGKVKQTPTVQVDPKSGLSYIVLKAKPTEKVYGCTKFANNYREDKKLGQGTFGEVYKGVHLATQRQIAMKKILVNVEKDLFPITAQREIVILKRLNHKNIIKLIEMVYDYAPDSSSSRAAEVKSLSTAAGPPASPSKHFYMILPYMVADLSGILHNPRITLEMPDIKNIMLQVLEGVNYIHCQKFMHRDIKAANILIDHNGILKLADFGLARTYYGSPPNLKYPGGAGSGAKYTSVVVTRWYRAPELVLGDKHYTTAVDIWGVGCVFAELFEKKPILQGSSDIDQGHIIFKLMGTPTEEEWKLAHYLPGSELTRTNYKSTIDERFGKWLDKSGLDFLKGLLALDPYKRLTAMSAVKHEFFKEEPLPSTTLSLPCEESHEADIKRYKEETHQAMSTKAPSAPQGHIIERSHSSTRVAALPRGPVMDRKMKPTGPNEQRQPPSVSHPRPDYSRYSQTKQQNTGNGYADPHHKYPVTNYSLKKRPYNNTPSYDSYNRAPLENEAKPQSRPSVQSRYNNATITLPLPKAPARAIPSKPVAHPATPSANKSPPRGPATSRYNSSMGRPTPVESAVQTTTKNSNTRKEGSLFGRVGVNIETSNPRNPETASNRRTSNTRMKRKQNFDEDQGDYDEQGDISDLY